MRHFYNNTAPEYTGSKNEMIKEYAARNGKETHTASLTSFFKDVSRTVCVNGLAYGQALIIAYRKESEQGEGFKQFLAKNRIPAATVDHYNQNVMNFYSFACPSPTIKEMQKEKFVTVSVAGSSDTHLDVCIDTAGKVFCDAEVSELKLNLFFSKGLIPFAEFNRQVAIEAVSLAGSVATSFELEENGAWFQYFATSSDYLNNGFKGEQADFFEGAKNYELQLDECKTKAEVVHPAPLSPQAISLIYIQESSTWSIAYIDPNTKEQQTTLVEKPPRAVFKDATPKEKIEASLAHFLQDVVVKEGLALSPEKNINEVFSVEQQTFIKNMVALCLGLTPSASTAVKAIAEIPRKEKSKDYKQFIEAAQEVINGLKKDETLHDFFKPIFVQERIEQIAEWSAQFAQDPKKEYDSTIFKELQQINLDFTQEIERAKLRQQLLSMLNDELKGQLDKEKLAERVKQKQVAAAQKGVDALTLDLTEQNRKQIEAIGEKQVRQACDENPMHLLYFDTFLAIDVDEFFEEDKVDLELGQVLNQVKAYQQGTENNIARVHEAVRSYLLFQQESLKRDKTDQVQQLYQLVALEKQLVDKKSQYSPKPKELVEQYWKEQSDQLEEQVKKLLERENVAKSAVHGNKEFSHLTQEQQANPLIVKAFLALHYIETLKSGMFRLYDAAINQLYGLLHGGDLADISLGEKADALFRDLPNVVDLLQSLSWQNKEYVSLVKTQQNIQQAHIIAKRQQQSNPFQQSDEWESTLSQIKLDAYTAIGQICKWDLSSGSFTITSQPPEFIIKKDIKGQLQFYQKQDKHDTLVHPLSVFQALSAEHRKNPNIIALFTVLNLLQGFKNYQNEVDIRDALALRQAILQVVTHASVTELEVKNLAKLLPEDRLKIGYQKVQDVNFSGALSKDLVESREMMAESEHAAQGIMARIARKVVAAELPSANNTTSGLNAIGRVCVIAQDLCSAATTESELRMLEEQLRQLLMEGLSPSEQADLQSNVVEALTLIASIVQANTLRIAAGHAITQLPESTTQQQKAELIRNAVGQMQQALVTTNAVVITDERYLEYLQSKLEDKAGINLSDLPKVDESQDAVALPTITAASTITDLQLNVSTLLTVDVSSPATIETKHLSQLVQQAQSRSEVLNNIELITQDHKNLSTIYQNFCDNLEKKLIAYLQKKHNDIPNIASATGLASLNFTDLQGKLWHPKVYACYAILSKLKNFDALEKQGLATPEDYQALFNAVNGIKKHNKETNNVAWSNDLNVALIQAFDAAKGIKAYLKDNSTATTRFSTTVAATLRAEEQELLTLEKKSQTPWWVRRQPKPTVVRQYCDVRTTLLNEATLLFHQASSHEELNEYANSMMLELQQALQKNLMSQRQFNIAKDILINLKTIQTVVLDAIQSIECAETVKDSIDIASEAEHMIHAIGDRTGAKKIPESYRERAINAIYARKQNKLNTLTEYYDKNKKQITLSAKEQKANIEKEQKKSQPGKTREMYVAFNQTRREAQQDIDVAQDLAALHRTINMFKTRFKDEVYNEKEYTKEKDSELLKKEVDVFLKHAVKARTAQILNEQRLRYEMQQITAQLKHDFNSEEKVPLGNRVKSQQAIRALSAQGIKPSVAAKIKAEGVRAIDVFNQQLVIKAEAAKSLKPKMVEVKFPVATATVEKSTELELKPLVKESTQEANEAIAEVICQAKIAIDTAKDINELKKLVEQIKEEGLKQIQIKYNSVMLDVPIATKIECAMNELEQLARTKNKGFTAVAEDSPLTTGVFGGSSFFKEPADTEDHSSENGYSSGEEKERRKVDSKLDSKLDVPPPEFN